MFGYQLIVTINYHCYQLVDTIKSTLFFYSVGFHNPHSPVWSYIPNGILPLQNKEIQTYNRVFMLLKDAALTWGISFDPLVIVSDFELAMVQASTMIILQL